MTINQIEEYVNSKPELTKIEITTELNEMGRYVVTKTKETYVFGDEREADRKVDSARQDAGFLGVDKKYKAGKLNKAGDVVKPETWTVVVKLAH